MNIVILARKPGLYFNKKIEQTGKSSGVKVRVIDPLSCELVLDGLNTRVYSDGKPVVDVDFVIPRMGPAVLEYGISVLRHFEIQGIPVLNNSIAIMNVLNRYEYLQILASHSNLMTPKSVLIRKSNQIKSAMDKVNGPPAVLKVMSSNNKLGALLIDKLSTAESYLDVNFVMGGMGQLGQNIIIEEYIKEASGKSIHILILNNEVIGSLYKIKAFGPKQTALIHEKPAKGLTMPDSVMSEMALYATTVLNLNFAMVGFLESIDGPKIYEIDVNPEIEIFEKEGGIQVPAGVLAYALQCNREKVSTGSE